MYTTSCSVPGVGNTPPDAEAERLDIAKTQMSNVWTAHSYRLSHDVQTNVIHHRDGVWIVKGGHKTFLEMSLTQHNPREWIWAPDSRRIAFWAPAEEGKTGKRIVSTLAPISPVFARIAEKFIDRLHEQISTGPLANASRWPSRNRLFNMAICFRRVSNKKPPWRLVVPLREGTWTTTSNRSPFWIPGLSQPSTTTSAVLGSRNT